MDILGKRFWFFLISAVVIIPGIISLAIFGLEPGVDFSSGTTMTLRFDAEVEQNQLRQELSGLGYDKAMIQRTGEGDFFVRVREISTEEKQELISSLGADLNTEVTVRDYYTVSPIIATETGRNAAIAIGIAAVFMLFYIAWAFRRMPKPFRWGTCAIIALIHDVLVVMGVFSILGWVAGVQIDAMFITGMLTVVGYSVNNTVVVFDRIRENVSKGISKDFEVTVNSSILETIARSLNTSLTTLFVILAVLLFGGITIRYFILVLLIGLISGTYSSMCIAAPLLVVWDKGEWGRFFSWLGFARKPA
ncbi:MAG: protein translocase subunit SecF [Dehalococcoidia bacterium]|nr:MAG: protein translocase subunit SecF [Dehalococcoidia bacterium]